MPRPSSLRAALLVLFSLGASVALAQQAPSSAPAARPCAADVARLCPDAHGRADVRACMQQNADQVSAECKARIDQARQRFQAVRDACQPDVAQFCADVKPGGRAIGQCLRSHASELSQACQSALPQHHAKGS